MKFRGCVGTGGHDTIPSFYVNMALHNQATAIFLKIDLYVYSKN